MPGAMRAANTAIRLNPNLAEAYAIVAWVKSFYEYDWAGAESAFQQAFRLDPKHPTTYHYYGLHQCQLGNFKEAQNRILEARRLDLTSFIIIHTAG